MLERAGAAVLIAGVTLSLAACQGSDPPPASTLPPSTSTSAPTTTVTSTPPATTPPATGAPTLPAEAQEMTPEGAAAFVRHWFRVLQYAQEEMISAPLTALDDGSCESCNNYASTIDSVLADGDRLAGGETTIFNAEPSQVSTDGAATVSCLVAFAETLRLRPDGTSEVLGPAEPSIGLFFDLVEGPSWRVDEIRLLG